MASSLRPWSLARFALLVSCLCLALAISSCGGGTTREQPREQPSGAITVAISPSPDYSGVLSLDTATGQQFSAVVSNDRSNSGVTWTLTHSYSHCQLMVCTPLGTYPCIQDECGTLSSLTSRSGALITYVTGLKMPSSNKPPYNGFGYIDPRINLTATSVADPKASASVGIFIFPVTIDVQPSSAYGGGVPVMMKSTRQFTATVRHDGVSAGVDWTLKSGGLSCAPTCGILDTAHTASGMPVTYTAPSSLDNNPVTLVATTTKGGVTQSNIIYVTPECSAGSGQESVLHGHYAFLLSGFDANGPAAIVGSIGADGMGRVDGGEIDSINTTNSRFDNGVNSGSFYWVGPDKRGCLQVITYGSSPPQQTKTFRFVLGSIDATGIATEGRIMEFDDSSGSGTRLVGVIRRQDDLLPIAATAEFKGNYAVGLAGIGSGGRFAAAGTMGLDMTSTSNAGVLDINEKGTLSRTTLATSFSCCISRSGRAEMMNDSFDLGQRSILYMVSPSNFFFISDGGGISSGEAVAIPAGTSFDASSLKGTAVLRSSGSSTLGSVATIGTVGADGNGSATLTTFRNSAGGFATGSFLSMYTVEGNGRVTFSGGAAHILYLYGANTGFALGADGSAELGALEPQTGGPFSNASFAGTYMFGVENPPGAATPLSIGIVTTDGVNKMSGMLDQSDSSGLKQNQGISGTYDLAPDGTGPLDPGAQGIAISGTKLVFIGRSSTTPSITVVEK